jgi:hypothetical protein
MYLQRTKSRALAGPSCGWSDAGLRGENRGSETREPNFGSESEDVRGGGHRQKLRQTRPSCQSRMSLSPMDKYSLMPICVHPYASRNAVTRIATTAT